MMALHALRAVKYLVLALDWVLRQLSSLLEPLCRGWKKLRGKKLKHVATLWTYERRVTHDALSGEWIRTSTFHDEVRQFLGEDRIGPMEGDPAYVAPGDSVEYRLGMLPMEDAALLKLKFGGQMHEQKLYEYV